MELRNPDGRRGIARWPTRKLRFIVFSEFGEAVEVVSARRAQPVACTDRVFCTPWRGGIKIWSDDGKRCSYGYNARSTSSATRYMITAGHCYNATWKHFGVVIGTTGFNNRDANSSGTALGDFQRVPSSALETPRNLVYASDSDKSRQITSRRPYTGQVYGDLACAAGFMSGYRCGFIRDDDNWICINHNGTKCYWAKRGGDAASPMQSIEGDSGGPVFVDGVALGIVAAVDAINFPYSSYWSTMDNGESALGVTLCFTSAC